MGYRKSIFPHHLQFFRLSLRLKEGWHMLQPITCFKKTRHFHQAHATIGVGITRIFGTRQQKNKPINHISQGQPQGSRGCPCGTCAYLNQDIRKSKTYLVLLLTLDKFLTLNDASKFSLSLPNRIFALISQSIIIYRY